MASKLLNVQWHFTSILDLYWELRKRIYSCLKQHAKTAQAQKRATEPPKLPILLKPENAAGKGAAAMPAFEVEEVNGQLVLLPTDGASGARKNPFAKVSRKYL